MTFRSNATQIADEYIKDKGIKLHRGRPKTNRVRDWTAYEEGVNDGKKIDAHRKRLKQRQQASIVGG